MLQVYGQNQHVLLLLLAEDYDNYNDFVIFFSWDKTSNFQ